MYGGVWEGRGGGKGGTGGQRGQGGGKPSHPLVYDAAM